MVTAPKTKTRKGKEGKPVKRRAPNGKPVKAQSAIERYYDADQAYWDAVCASRIAVSEPVTLVDHEGTELSNSPLMARDGGAALRGLPRGEETRESNPLDMIACAIHDRLTSEEREEIGGMPKESAKAYCRRHGCIVSIPYTDSLACTSECASRTKPVRATCHCDRTLIGHTTACRESTSARASRPACDCGMAAWREATGDAHAMPDPDTLVTLYLARERAKERVARDCAGRVTQHSRKEPTDREIARPTFGPAIAPVDRLPAMPAMAWQGAYHVYRAGDLRRSPEISEPVYDATAELAEYARYARYWLNRALPAGNREEVTEECAYADWLAFSYRARYVNMPSYPLGSTPPSHSVDAGRMHAEGNMSPVTGHTPGRAACRYTEGIPVDRSAILAQYLSQCSRMPPSADGGW